MVAEGSSCESIQSPCSYILLELTIPLSRIECLKPHAEIGLLFGRKGFDFAFQSLDLGHGAEFSIVGFVDP